MSDLSEYYLKLVFIRYLMRNDANVVQCFFFEYLKQTNIKLITNQYISQLMIDFEKTV